MNVELALVLVVIFIISGIVAGLRLFAVFGLASLALLALTRAASFDILVPTGLSLLQNFAFLALPLYVIVGRLMEAGALADRMLTFLRALLPKIKSMFGAQTIMFCVVFGAISGSALSAIAAIGGIVIPRAKDYGYTRGYMTGVIACSCLIAMLIPPSLTMIIFAIASGLSVARCFLCTAVPGLLTATAYVIINYFLTRKVTSPVQPPLLTS